MGGVTVSKEVCFFCKEVLEKTANEKYEETYRITASKHKGDIEVMAIIEPQYCPVCGIRINEGEGCKITIGEPLQQRDREIHAAIEYLREQGEI